MTGLRQGAADLTTLANNTRRGFTDHEHLDSLGLIHMHGRVYDPTVGRFLSVDPMVRDAAASQALREGRLVAGPNGVLPGGRAGAVLDVNGVNVQLVGGRVVNGEVQIGTFSRRCLGD